MTFIDEITQLILNLPLNSISFAWSIINPILIENWLKLTVAIIILINIAMLKFLITGKWGTLGSLLYNFFFFGIMYLIINNFGPEIILEDYFKIISFLTYITGFFLTRLVLRSVRVENMPKFRFLKAS
jgi:hypothetical protein